MHNTPAHLKPLIDLTPQPRDVIAERLDSLIERVEFLLMENGGNA